MFENNHERKDENEKTEMIEFTDKVAVITGLAGDRIADCA